MKKRFKIIGLILLVLMLFSATFSWYENNRQVLLIGTDNDTIKIQSNGVLQIAYAVDSGGNEISVSNASFDNELQMSLKGNGYENVTGNGAAGYIYSPTLDSTGSPQADGSMWELATYDNAASSTDKGQCVVVDLFFRSDEEMDIYLLQSSALSPVSSGNDLVNKTGYESKTTFASFGTAGLPNLNKNQSSYGLFSRNLIAGAGRVSFSTADSSGNFASTPDVVWVPNSTYELTIPTVSGRLYTASLKGTAESSYSYYTRTQSGDSYTYSAITVGRNSNTGRLTGEIYRQAGSSYERCQYVATVGDEIYPGYKIANAANPVPAIWNGSAYVAAAVATDSEGNEFLAAASYDDSVRAAFKVTIGGATKYVRTNTAGEEGKEYNEVSLVTDKLGVKSWQTTGVTYSAAQVEAGFQRDSSTYKKTAWMDNKNFSNLIDGRNCSTYKIATTSSSTGSFYYTRVKILVWVEGQDREATLALSGGEFNVSLDFYGLKVES